MTTKIEIEVKKTDKTIAGLVNAMGDDGFIGVVTTEIISGLSEKPDEWLTQERKDAFEKKLNEQDENYSYEVVGVKKVFSQNEI